MWQLSRSKSRFLGKSNGIDIAVFGASLTRFWYCITLEGPAIGAGHRMGFTPQLVRSRQVQRSYIFNSKYWGEKIESKLDSLYKIEIESRGQNHNRHITAHNKLSLTCVSSRCRWNFPSWRWTCFVYCKHWSENHKRICQTSCMIHHRLLGALLL